MILRMKRSPEHLDREELPVLINRTQMKTEGMRKINTEKNYQYSQAGC
jgi:hypothetical protein